MWKLLLMSPYLKQSDNLLNVVCNERVRSSVNGGAIYHNADD